jgi:hypothetical protein
MNHLKYDEHISFLMSTPEVFSCAEVAFGNHHRRAWFLGVLFKKSQDYQRALGFASQRKMFFRFLLDKKINYDYALYRLGELHI